MPCRRRAVVAFGGRRAPGAPVPGWNRRLRTGILRWQDRGSLAHMHRERRPCTGQIGPEPAPRLHRLHGSGSAALRPPQHGHRRVQQSPALSRFRGLHAKSDDSRTGSEACRLLEGRRPRPRSLRITQSRVRAVPGRQDGLFRLPGKASGYGRRPEPALTQRGASMPARFSNCRTLDTLQTQNDASAGWVTARSAPSRRRGGMSSTTDQFPGTQIRLPAPASSSMS